MNMDHITLEKKHGDKEQCQEISDIVKDNS